MKLWMALNTLGMRKTLWLIPAAAITLFSLAVVFCGMQPCVGNDATQGFRLGISRVASTGKPCFILDGQPFYPILYSVHYSALTSSDLDDLQQQGFNVLQVAVDTAEVSEPAFQHLMSLCSEANLPVFLEIHEWSFWDILKARPELNMVMSDGKRVEHFPDYANPETRREHLHRYLEAAKKLSPYVHQPIIAVTVGAYDAYHLPDGEKHVDFTVPHHNQPFQTRLPYGRWSLEGFKKYLAATGSDTSSLLTALPVSRSEASCDEVWCHWILFRRKLVSSWLTDTIDVVREQTGLLVGVSLDLKFAQQERFATPVFEWSDIVDFVSVYSYGGKPFHNTAHRLPWKNESYDESGAGYVPNLMRTTWREYSQSGVPMIGFLEFSSALAGGTPGEAYARQCAPFVSGLMTASPNPSLKHGQDRVDSFVKWAIDQGAPTALLQSKPDPAIVLVVVCKDRIYADHAAHRELTHHSITYDVEYATSGFNQSDYDQYECVVVDGDLPLPDPDESCDATYIRDYDLSKWILKKVKTR